MNKFELFKNFNLDLVELIKGLEKELLDLHNKHKTANNNQNAQTGPQNKKPVMWRLGRYINSIGRNESVLFLYKNRKNSLNDYSKFEEKLEKIVEEVKLNINFNILENSNEEIPDVIRKFKLNLNSLIAKYAGELQSDWEDEREDQIRSSGHEDRSADELENLHKTGGEPSPDKQSATRTIPMPSSEEEKIVEEFSKLESESKIDTLIKSIIIIHNKNKDESSKEVAIDNVSNLSIELSKFLEKGGESYLLSIVNLLSEKEREDYERKLDEIDSKIQ
jgi:hypothetical protein